MKVETPQVRWHADDKGKNQALFGVSLLPAGASTHILATAGNTFSIHLWRVHFAEPASPSSSGSSSSKTSFEYLTSLNRHESSVNALSFSPDGLHLATASDAGALIVWSVPVHLRGNGNGRHFWSQVTKESELRVNIVPRGWGDGITDLSWSSDSKRLMLGTIDNTVLVCEDTHYQDMTQETAWKCVHRNSVDHTHFVQGVAYDPKGVYLTSMSSDRSVRIHMRKIPGKKSMKKKVLRTVVNASSSKARSSSIPPPSQERLAEALLTDSKLDMGTKTKQIKYRRPANQPHNESTVLDQPSEGNAVTGPKPARQALFADESTLQSFVRRLAWTPDGAYLITPAVMWHTTPDSQPQFATALWGRHRWEEPARVLLGMEKPSVAVRPNPVLFELPPCIPMSQDDDAKENKSSKATGHNLPYRSVFAVLTWDSVLIYDTVHAQPLAVARGLHYAHMTDATWSVDGHRLIVCSSDGYLSVLSFSPGELGRVYTPPAEEAAAHSAAPDTTSSNTSNTSALNRVRVTASNGQVKTLSSPAQSAKVVPPCEPGNANVVDGPPAKKQKVRITPTCIRATTEIGKVTAQMSVGEDEIMADSVGQAVHQLSLEEPSIGGDSKQKKRIQPTLVSTG